ncbi:hypothetical protein [Chryseobacterium sp. KMC2]|uniref:hypothetical protein n=1 Tax=Chryseobacterium sp. KMC2 TaxID=2800705 RepID=UPI00192237EE|nr:hypothetical protein [Chryseobacterium sp. KMC2]MBL3548136.1 hypothetical protein [Chryseobacterium sp. KMC2]
MKNKFILWLSLLIAFNLIFHSCRTEDMYQENERQKQDLRASVLRFHEISNNTSLLQKVTQLQTELFSSNKLLGKNNSILDGATISTDRVILVENGTQKTYTFPVKRASKNSGLENLVLKQTADGTFSGVLIQYDITPLEKDLFVLGEEIDMENKIKIFDINNLSLSQKIVTAALGCYVVTWENGVCGSGQHGYGDDTCQLTGSGAASAPGIISIVNTCSGGAGGTNTGIPSYPNPDSPGGNTGGYGTLPYSDDSDLMLAKYQEFSNIFHINSYGFNSTLRTKLFYLYLYQFEDQYTVSKLLSYFGTKPDILNNTVDMFLDNASLSWDDFYNQFLVTPCEKTKNIMSKPDVQSKITELKNKSKIGGEIGVKIKADGTTSETISGGGHEVELGDTAGYQGGYHNHTPTGIKMLSPPDIVKMLDFSMAQPNGNIRDGFMGMFGSERCSTCPDGYRYYNYIANFSGTAQELAGFLFSTKYDLVKLMKDYRKTEKDLSANLSYVDYFGADLNNKGLEKLFFDTLKNMGMEGKVNLQKIEDNGTVQNITLDSNGNSTTATPCP